jgi:DNA-binding transcriptional regulator GbsR (MarR family)
MQRRPVSKKCPRCGSSEYTRITAWTFVTFANDRKCRRCETAYTPPTPIWAGVVFLVLGLFVLPFMCMGLGGLIARGGGLVGLLLGSPLALGAIWKGFATLASGLSGGMRPVDVGLKLRSSSKNGKSTVAEVLTAVERDFIELWCSLTFFWGMNSSMARIHGLLFITGKQMTCDEIMEELVISREKVSMYMAKLLEFGLVRPVQKPGNRREYWESVSDVGAIFAALAARRQRVEVDPALSALHRCNERLSLEQVEVGTDTEAVQHYARRIDGVFSLLTRWSERADVLVSRELEK